MAGTVTIKESKPKRPVSVNRAIDAIADAVKNDDDRLSRVVLGIVTSHPFRYRSTPEASK